MNVTYCDTLQPSRITRRSNCMSIGIAVAAFMSLLALIGQGATARAASAANAKSPLSLNLLPIDYWTEEQPFLNIFKTTGVSGTNASGWYTHSATVWDTGESAYLQRDINGYPTSLVASSADPNSPQLFTSVGVLLERGLSKSNGGVGLPYRAGQYVVLYDGQGTISYGFDAKLVSSSPGRDVINVANPSTGGGIDLRITSTDPGHTGNYIRNIRVVYSAEESLLTAGNVFSPNFLSLMQNFGALRFMQWLQIDGAGGTLNSWSSRPLTTDAGWGGPTGVPVEVALQLCNALISDCWLNIPHAANNDYISQMASVAHATLGSSQHVYIEFSNEVWNGTYAQYAYAIAQGQAIWPGAGSSSFDYNSSWYGMRTAQSCDIWKSVWGSDASRVICVMGAQAANTGVGIDNLKCKLWTGTGNAPCASHGINAVAIAPYFGFTAPVSWTTAADGGLGQLFAQLANSTQPQVSAWEAAYKTALAPFNLPMIAYEGGQSFIANAPGALLNLYTAANRDPRMAAAYTTALTNWQANGGQTYALFAGMYAPSQYGEWGALESFMDTVSPLSSAPPKWQAIQNFISSTPCWWAGCTGIIGTASTPTPVAPVLTVH